MSKVSKGKESKGIRFDVFIIIFTIALIVFSLIAYHLPKDKQEIHELEPENKIVMTILPSLN